MNKVRVIRVLEYYGEPEAIKDQLDNCWLYPGVDRLMHKLEIREISRTISNEPQIVLNQESSDAIPF